MSGKEWGKNDCYSAGARTFLSAATLERRVAGIRMPLRTGMSGGGVQKRRPGRYMALSPALVSIIPFEMACRVNPATS